MLHRFEIFSAPGTIAHGSIRLLPRSLARPSCLRMTSKGESYVYKNTRSSHLKQWQINPPPYQKKKEKKKSMGFEPITSALALQCSTNWSMKTSTLGVGQFAEFIFTRQWNKTWKEDYVSCGNTNFNEDMFDILFVSEYAFIISLASLSHERGMLPI